MDNKALDPTSGFALRAPPEVGQGQRLPEQNMTRIERFAVLAVVLYVVATVLRIAGAYFRFELVSELNWSARSVAFLSLPVMLIVMAVQIAVAIWLYFLAKRESAAPWVWAMFGLIFGLVAVAVFYCERIYLHMKHNRMASEQTHGDATSDSAPSEESEASHA